MEISGSLAYVPQQAWIQNAKLRDNILFGTKFEEERYGEAVASCALAADLAMLPAGDETEIGEKGINLSGGQKQRVSLARAVYADKDIYLLDDPLSAVDSHVGRHIFDQVLGPEGCLKHKTRLLVTHSITYLTKVDKIIVMKKGVVSECGSYEELLAQKGDFADFLLQNLSDQSDENLELEELDVIKTGLEQHLGQEELQKHLSKSMSVASRDSGNSIKDTTAGDDKEKGTNKPKTNLQKQYQEEHQGTGSVPWRVYMFYFKNMGLMMFAGCFLMYAVFQTFTVMSSIWVSFWSDNRFPLEEALEDRLMTTSRRNIFLGVYGACGLAQALGAVLASIMLYTASVRGGRGLHQKMLHSVIHAPMTFFDTTPQGRILNRFSKDVDVLDTTMPNILRGWMTRMLTVVSTFLVIMVATPLAIIPIFVVMCGYYFVLKVYVSVSRQLKRVESTTRSPIYSHFGETISGAATIRAYGRQGEFVRESERRVDRNHQATFCSNVANRWLAVRLEAVGNIIVFAAALFSVLGRDSLSPGLVGLSVSYALQVKSPWALYNNWRTFYHSS